MTARQRRRCRRLAVALAASWLLHAAVAPAAAQVRSLAEAEAVVHELVATRFPELAHRRIQVRALAARGDYFRTSFSVRRYFLIEPMRYVIKVNPEVWLQGAPDDGVRAILAHELSHVVQLSRGPRIRRLGLVRLLRERSEARFERQADLDALARGFGPGLKAYRAWLYGHVPADVLPEKRAHYFGPEEIDAIERRLAVRPDLLAHWRRHPPLSLTEIEAAPPPNPETRGLRRPGVSCDKAAPPKPAPRWRSDVPTALPPVRRAPRGLVGRGARRGPVPVDARLPGHCPEAGAAAGAQAR
ncbi:MAG: hypothetical protein AB7O28_13770 [Vicinamibacterales bacterium]